ncbi:MAG: hypothetical protein ABSE48_02700 [Verrucomicrobiota bacterium]|jgi:hypothetical protein
MAATIYAGPGKLYFNSVAFQANDTNGEILARTVQDTDPAAVSMFGRIGYLQGNVVETIDLTPFENWGLLKTLFPAFLGVSCGTQTGALKIGTQPHNPAGAADAPGVIYTPDGRLYTFPRCAIIKHPDIHLGANKPLFGPMQFANILATGKTLGAAGAFHSVTESGGSDPGGAFITSDFDRGAWYGAWGTTAGFGGDGGSALEAEDGFTIHTAVKYSPLPVQKLVRAYKLDEVWFMCKGRLYGPTHTQITAATGIGSGRTLGEFIPTGNAADLVLTGPNSKSVTLTNADVVSAGFDFGGTKLGTDEVGFVSGMTFMAGVPQPLLVFSA